MEGLDRKFMTLCFDISLEPARVAEGKKTSVFDAANGCATYTNCYNDFAAPSDDAAVVKKLVVIGGDVANIGEDQLSCLVLKSKDVLEEIRYQPHRTKGGLFIRPYYGAHVVDNRSRMCTFPNIKTISVNAAGVPTLMSTYVLPSIETINVGIKAECVNGPEFKRLSDKLFLWYPSLKTVNGVTSLE